MTYTKPHILDENDIQPGFEVNYGPHEDVFRVTVTSGDGVWLVDFDDLGMIVKVVPPSGFDDPPLWQDASRAIRIALTTYLMQRNT